MSGIAPSISPRGDRVRERTWVSATAPSREGLSDAVRALGVDVGTVRVGVALSDPARLVATPLTSLAAGPDLAGRLVEVAREHDCPTVVVGLPKALSGRDTASTAMARDLAAAVAQQGLDVHLWDERLSSAQAERVLLLAGRRRAQRRTERDPIAAAIILQGWLDATPTANEDGAA
ncbi:MAG: Holliday junction resolvase RuvX [Actinomycetota bacterium]|nr:Holliday junction resolvase RuvX [Actinomycetota bacterium]